MLLTLVLGAILAALVASIVATERKAEATFPGANGRIAFDSKRTMGTGVDNPTGDAEIFTIKPDGTGLKQLTHNTVNDFQPVVSPDGTKIAYTSYTGDDLEVYTMKASDGTGQKNLTNNGTDVDDFGPAFSPGGGKIAYFSYGIQNSNPQGDDEVYVMNALDGSGKKNLSDNNAYDELSDSTFHRG